MWAPIPYSMESPTVITCHFLLVLLHGSDLASSDASLDGVPRPSTLWGYWTCSLVGDTQVEQEPSSCCRKSQSFQPSPFPNPISTDHLILPQYSWGLRLQGLGKRSGWSLSHHLWYCTVCWPFLEPPWQHRSRTTAHVLQARKLSPSVPASVRDPSHLLYSESCILPQELGLDWGLWHYRDNCSNGWRWCPVIH